MCPIYCSQLNFFFSLLQIKLVPEIMASFGAKHSVGRRLHTVLTSSVSGAAATSSSAVCTPPPIHWSHWKLTARNMSSATWQHTVTLDNLNPCIKTMEYAVRGPLVIRAVEIEKEIQSVRTRIHFRYYCCE